MSQSEAEETMASSTQHEEDYLSQICRGSEEVKSEVNQEDFKQNENNQPKQSPTKKSQDEEGLEIPLEQRDFNQNLITSPKATSSPKTTVGIINNKSEDQKSSSSKVSYNDLVDDNSSETMETVESQTNEAEEIIKKLCKNGKIKQVQDDENYIRLIVYEDSQESNDQDDTLSAEEIEEGSNDRKDQGTCATKNLLQCLTENTAVSRYEGACSTPLQPYPVGGSFQNAIGNPMQFAPPGHQGLPATYALSSTGELVHTNNLMAHSNTGPVPVALHASQQCTPHPRNGFMFYRPNDSQQIPLPHGAHTYKHHVTSTGQMAAPTTQLQLNSSGEEHTSPTEFKPTPSSSRGKMQPKIKALIQPPPYPGEEWGKIREQHNQKERRRRIFPMIYHSKYRARIKEACNLLRQLVPGMSDKTDKATVFEFAARYVHFLKSHNGAQFDKDFLMKYSPY